MMDRRKFINSTLLAGAAVSLPGLGLSLITKRPKTTVIGIGGCGIRFIATAKKAFLHNVNYIAIDTKGEWNTEMHCLIDIDYRRLVRWYGPYDIVVFGEDDESIQQDWRNNYASLEPVFESKGKVIVVASLSGTMGGIIGHKIIREIVSKKLAEVSYMAVAPFSFEGKRARSEDKYSRVYETGGQCSRFEIIENDEALKTFKGSLKESFEWVNHSIVKRIEPLI